MATIKIGNDNSINETVAFNALTNSEGGVLTVETDGFVFASGATERAIYLQGPAWTITINGLVSVDMAPFSRAVASATFLTGPTKISIGDTGAIYSSGSGVTTSGKGTVTNAGLIEAVADHAVSVGIDSSVTNTGVIRSFGSQSTVDFYQNGKHKLTNYGTIESLGSGAAVEVFATSVSATLSNSGKIVGNIQHGDATTALTNTGSIKGNITTGTGNDKFTNAKSAIIDGKIEAGEGNDVVINAGEIKLDVLLGLGNDTVTNTGILKDDLGLSHGNNTLTNSGTIGENATEEVGGGSGNDVLMNSGTIYVGVNLDDGTNKITNSGTIKGDVTTTVDNDTLTNSGLIEGAVNLGDGLNKVTNSGTMKSNLTLGGGNDVVTSSGIIEGSVDLGDGINTLTQTKGTIGAITGGASVDKLTIGGTVNGAVSLGDGDDVVTVLATGTLSYDPNLGGGNDTFTGNSTNELMRDSDGGDTIKLGGGDDLYFAAEGASGLDDTDLVDGGTGKDTYDAGSAAGQLTINLGTLDFTHASFVGSITKSKAAGSGIGTDVITNFENVGGGLSHDFIVGSAAANILDGRDGSDTLFGLAGNDTLFGGGDAFKDRLYGGLGADTLYGGNGSGADGTVDLFIFESIAESTVALKGRDTIMDFEGAGVAGGDIVDLQAIDANTKAGQLGNQDFTWLGLNGVFTGAGGELRYFHAGSDLTILYGDTNGDKKADFAINFKGQLTLTADDFTL